MVGRLFALSAEAVPPAAAALEAETVVGRLFALSAEAVPPATAALEAETVVGRQRGSTSKLVLFILFVSFVTFAVEISRPAEDQLYPRVKEAEVQKVDFTFLKPLNFIFFIPKNRSL